MHDKTSKWWRISPFWVFTHIMLKVFILAMQAILLDTLPQTILGILSDKVYNIALYYHSSLVCVEENVFLLGYGYSRSYTTCRCSKNKHYNNKNYKNKN